MFSVVRTYETARLWAILHIVSYTLIFVFQNAWKLTLINQGVSGVWSMDLIEIYRTIRWVSEISCLRHELYIPRVSWRTWLRHGQYPTGIYFIVDGPGGKTGSIPRGSAVWPMDLMETWAVPKGGLLYGRWTGWRQAQYPKGVCCMVQWTGQRQGQYPKGVCYMVDGPDWGRRSIPRGSAVWFNGPDRGRGSIPRGSAIWSMDRIEEQHGYLQYGLWTWRTYEEMGLYTTWCLNNGQWNHSMLDWQYWTQNQLVWHEYYVHLEKGKANLPLIDLFTSETENMHLFSLGYDLYWCHNVKCLLYKLQHCVDRNIW